MPKTATSRAAGMAKNDGLHFAAIDIFTSVEVTIDILIAGVSSAKETVSEGCGRILLVAPVSAYYVYATRQQFTALTVACDVQTDLSNPSASSMRPSMAPCLSRSKMPLMTSVAGSQLKMDAILLRPRTAVPAFAALIQSLRFQPFWFGRAAGNEDSSK